MIALTDIRCLAASGRIPRVATRAAAAVAAAALAIAGPPSDVATARQATGRIEGLVRLVVPPINAVPSGVYPARRVSRRPAPAAEIENVIVFVRGAASGGDLPVTQTKILQQDEAFVPRVVAVTRGSTIGFPNADPFFHNVFSLSRGANFDLGRYPRGETRSYRFTAPGLVKVYCHIHSHMSASIMVFDHPYFRIPSPNGTFAIEDVPVGTYHVGAWHERIGDSISAVRVEAGRTARIEFALPVEQR